MVFVLLSQVFLHIFRSGKYAHKPFNSSSSVPCSSVFLEIFLISFQGELFGGPISPVQALRLQVPGVELEYSRGKNPFLCDTYWM